MKTILFALVAVVSLSMVDVASAQIFGGRRRTRVTYAPAPAATVAQGQAATGYRTYSYEPSAPVYRSYSAPKKWSWDYPKTDARRYSGN